MRTIRASEISAYLYCQRAWWYRLQGLESQNQTELSSGLRLHARHGRAVLVGGCLQTLAVLAILAALVLVVMQLTSLLIRSWPAA